MRLCKFLKIMGVVVVLALAYIHMQMKIVDLAYRGNFKERAIKRLVEDNGNNTYKILMLKSANHLGGTMLEENSPMQFADANNVIKISAWEEIFMEDSPVGQPPRLAKQTNPLLSLLSFGVEAEAKTSK